MQSDTITDVDETIGTELEPQSDGGETNPAGDETDGLSLVDAIGTGAPAPETGAYAAGGGSGLAIEMARTAFADDLARAEEGVLSYGFDLDRAWREIEGIASSVADKKSAWDSAKAEAAECKKDYDLEVETLRKRIAALSDERRKPALPLSGSEPLTSAPKTCAFTQRTGQPCPVCRQRETGPAAVPTIDSPLHPDHAQHEQAASEAAARAFIDRLAEAEVFLEVPEVLAMDLSAKAVLEQWLNERVVIAAAQANDAEIVPLPLPDAFARKAHIAGDADIEAGRGQMCTRCGRQLLDDVDIADDGTYPTGALVGLDCEGAEEIARPVKKRGRAKKNRPAPETERAEQIAAAYTVTDDGDEVE